MSDRAGRMYSDMCKGRLSFLLITFTVMIYCVTVPAGAASGSLFVTPTLTQTWHLGYIPIVTETSVNEHGVLVTPETGSLSIDSNPSGASVSLDGTVVGTTPYSADDVAFGTHTILLTLAGYYDYPDSISIATDQELQQSYTLSAVTQSNTKTTPKTTRKVRARKTVTTEATTVPVTTTTNAPPVRRNLPQRATNLTAQLRIPEGRTYKQLTITVNGHTKSPVLTTFSPYFRFQFVPTDTGGTKGVRMLSPQVSLPKGFIEVDQLNVYLPQSRLMSSAETTNDPVWGDTDSIYISTTQTSGKDVNFRWVSSVLESGDVTGFYQVSRYPFTSDASHWQNQYIPGLVSSGPVKDVFVDKDGYHYFTLNFAQVANHNPGEPPIYTGIASYAESIANRGTVTPITRIPFTSTGVTTTKASIGSFTLMIPSGLIAIPAGERTETELGNPNENITLSLAHALARSSTRLETSLLGLDQTYYVRVIPIHNDGTAGIPTLPVEVTVKRPDPCPPATPPGNGVTNIVVSPPSVSVDSFYMTALWPDRAPYTNENGNYVNPAHFVTVGSPQDCTSDLNGLHVSSDDVSLVCNDPLVHQPGFHFTLHPQEENWYDSFVEFFSSLFSALESIVDAVSSAWNAIENAVLDVAAFAVKAATFGTYDCSGSGACMAVLKTGLSVAESSLGIPPSIPNSADLESMGTDYMAKVGAEEIGAGGIMEAAQNAYGTIPPEAQDQITGKASDIAGSMAGSLSSQSYSTAAASAGNWYIPDPLYYQAHPAFVMVRVSNPNPTPSDPVFIRVSDSAGLYKLSKNYVPSLKAGDSTIIPVTLEENFDKIFTSDCNANSYTISCAGPDMSDCTPCYWNNWITAWIAASPPNGPGNTFMVTMWTTKDNVLLDPLDPTSSGRLVSSTSQNVITINQAGESCPMINYNAKTYLQYPANWQMQMTKTPPQNIANVMFQYYFTEGDHGRLNT